MAADYDKSSTLYGKVYYLLVEVSIFRNSSPSSKFYIVIDKHFIREYEKIKAGLRMLEETGSREYEVSTSVNAVHPQNPFLYFGNPSSLRTVKDIHIEDVFGKAHIYTLCTSNLEKPGDSPSTRPIKMIIGDGRVRFHKNFDCGIPIDALEKVLKELK